MGTNLDCCETPATSRRAVLLGGSSFAAWAYLPKFARAADAASMETRRAVERAESRQQALALLLMSPEFQRR